MYRKAANLTTRSFTRSNCILETSTRSPRTPGTGSNRETKGPSSLNFRVQAMTCFTSSLILVSIVSPKSLNRRYPSHVVQFSLFNPLKRRNGTLEQGDNLADFYQRTTLATHMNLLHNPSLVFQEIP